MVDSIAGLIDKAFNDEKPRPYYGKGSIGASAVGNSCDAYLAISLRAFPEGTIDPQLKRIFRDGHRIENVVLADMAKAGLHVMDKDPSTGKQWKWVKYGGHIVFKADGILEVDGKAKLVEIKSMNHALWTKFKGYGIRISHPHYYDQMQLGMGMSGIQSCIMVAYNKDKSTYWDEEVQFDMVRYNYLLHRAETAMKGVVSKIATDETDWRCRGCHKAAACWGKVDIPKTIRTCKNSHPMNDGTFACDKGCTEATGCIGPYELFSTGDRTV